MADDPVCTIPTVNSITLQLTGESRGKFAILQKIHICVWFTEDAKDKTGVGNIRDTLLFPRTVGTL